MIKIQHCKSTSENQKLIALIVLRGLNVRITQTRKLRLSRHINRFCYICIFSCSFFSVIYLAEVGLSRPIHAKYPIIMETGRVCGFFITMKEILKSLAILYDTKFRVRDVACKKKSCVNCSNVSSFHDEKNCVLRSTL